MPTYEYRCSHGHTTERVQSMRDEIPAEICCTHGGDDGCDDVAARVWAAPAAIHFKGPGFFATDVDGRYRRRRRKNAGDDLPLPIEAGIGRAEGAQYDSPRAVPGGVVPGVATRSVSGKETPRGRRR